MSDAQTPAEARAEKQQAAHDNQVKAEKDFAAKLPKGSDAAQGEIAAPVKSKEGTSYPKDGRDEPAVGTVEYYTAGTAGDNADPDKVFESRDPANSPVAALPSEDDQKEAAKAADETRVKVDKSNPYGQADKKFEGNSDEATAKKQNAGAAKTPAQDSGNDGAKADNAARNADNATGGKDSASK